MRESGERSDGTGACENWTPKDERNGITNDSLLGKKSRAQIQVGKGQLKWYIICNQDTSHMKESILISRTVGLMHKH